LLKTPGGGAEKGHETLLEFTRRTPEKPSKGGELGIGIKKKNSRHSPKEGTKDWVSKREGGRMRESNKLKEGRNGAKFQMKGESAGGRRLGALLVPPPREPKDKERGIERM